MASRLTEEELLELLQRKEDSASHYVHGQLGDEREQSMREYHRMPYGNEQDGFSDIVASDVQDTVEWILPALLEIFTATDKAVEFEPTQAQDVKGADQATSACNYVFYKQNNGFLILYTAFKDALTVKNCAVMWRKETSQVVSSIPFKGATAEMLTMILNENDAEIQEVQESPAIGQDGQPVMEPVIMDGIPMLHPVMTYSGRLKKTEEKTICKIDAFSPEDLLIDRDWNSPLLADCPYVSRLMFVTMTDVKQMGLDCTADELRASDMGGNTVDSTSRLSNVNRPDASSVSDIQEFDDPSTAEGWLRIEYVLADMDGDGIAERVCVYRLRDKILKQEVVSHVPIATTSPILNTHRWDGQSIADLVSDLQKLDTSLLRETLDNLKLTNNPRTKLLTDSNGNPKANIDDLLDSRVGGIIRITDPNAVTEQVTPFAAAASMPMLEYVQGMRENRTGVSRTSMGLNPDSLNNTATGRQLDVSSAAQRTKLIARIFAETLVKPIFQGILKLLTDGGMEKISFRLRDEFVEYDPNEWRDQYDMTINVGLGTGDTMKQGQMLTMIYQMQQAGMGLGIATPKHLYHTQSKIIENAGFKDVQNFIQDPSAQPPQPPKPDPVMQLEQMKIQADAQKFQAETAQKKELEQVKANAKLLEVQANLELQRSNDERDAARQMAKDASDAELEMARIASAERQAVLTAETSRENAKLASETSIFIEQMRIANQPVEPQQPNFEVQP
jgi:hypothetical protein